MKIIIPCIFVQCCHVLTQFFERSPTLPLFRWVSQVVDYMKNLFYFHPCKHNSVLGWFVVVAGMYFPDWIRIVVDLVVHGRFWFKELRWLCWLGKGAEVVVLVKERKLAPRVSVCITWLPKAALPILLAATSSQLRYCFSDPVPALGISVHNTLLKANIHSLVWGKDWDSYCKIFN
jgi:hypothetical protein